MGPKQKKKENLFTDGIGKETIIEVAEQVTEVVDPYLELRYAALLPTIQPRRPAPRLQKMLVLRKKRFTPYVSAAQAPVYQAQRHMSVVPKRKQSVKSDTSMTAGISRQFLKGKEEIDPNFLNIAAINTRPLSKWYAPAELPRIPQPLEVLRRNKQETSDFSRMIEYSFRKEFAILRQFEKTKKEELHMENRIMDGIGKTRQELLIRKKQFLPHIDHIGQEKTHGPFERTETPEIICDNQLSSEAARTVVEKNGICRTLTRREKGYNIVTDWVGCPEVTDFIAEMLGKPSGSGYNITYQSQENEPVVEGENFVPKFEELAVVGLSYENAQQQLKNIAAAKIKKEAPKSPYAAEIAKSRQVFKMDLEHVHFLGNESVDFGTSLAGLAIGQIKLFWTREPERSKKKWVVELGCTAEIGRNSIGSITMKNIGSTAIHFKWEKLPPENTFKLVRYNIAHFVFDCWGGMILPGETFRVPVLYKCIEPGVYSEDWQLLTQPVLENGAAIITRLWGITHHYDPYRYIREEIDTELEKRIGNTIVEHRVQKLISHLPVKEVPLKDTRFQLVHLGPDLFHLNNPTLKYHFASVYRLGKLAAMTENKRQIMSTFQSEKSALSIMYTDTDEVVSEMVVGSRFNTGVGSNEILVYTVKSSEFSEEEDGGLIQNGMYSDGASAYSDEERSTSIWYIKRLIEEQINPDIPVLAVDTQEPVEDEVDFEETSRNRPSAINLVNTDFSVDTIRENILENGVDPQEHREAQFLILSEQVTRLLFSTDKPIDNWKSVVARSLLCSVMDTFSDFATFLKGKCCEGQLMQVPKDAEVSTIGADTSVGGDDESILPEEMSSEVSVSYLDERSDVTLSCLEADPRRGMQYLRYQDQYYSRLYCRMYSLLSDYLDSFHELLTEAQTLQIVQEDIGFTRVKDIPMNFRLEDLLNAPLPPGWVMLAQRMDNAVCKNQARKKALNDGLTC